jgi:hypothetical protein
MERGVGENKNPKGELGVLKEVQPCVIPQAGRCYLIMDDALL